MRMRKKKNRDARMERCQAVWVREPALLRGHWRERFRPGCELRLEIGCGKGAFTVKTAQNEPDVFLVGLERSPDAALIAMERAIEAGLTTSPLSAGMRLISPTCLPPAKWTASTSTSATPGPANATPNGG